MKMSYLDEKYQLGILTDYLESSHFIYKTEVEMYSIPIDVVAEKSDEIYSIELKTKDFKRGIAQAQRNTQYSNYSYLSVWDSMLTENLIKRVDKLDIGLLSIDNSVECVSDPARVEPNEYAKSKIRRKLDNEI